MNFVTFSQLNKCIVENIHKIPRDVDLVVGIPRSGSLVAGIIGLLLNVPIMDLNSFMAGLPIMTGSTRKKANWITHPKQAKHILLIDDSNSTGEAVKRAKTAMRPLDLNVPITTCAIYALPTNIFTVDIHFTICNHPRMFEWNYMHHWGLEYACLDIDGVVCVDPSVITSQLDTHYVRFLETAAPKVIPTQKVGYFVTSRKEKYRALTVQWLKEQGIEFEHLIMLDEHTDTVMTNRDYGNFKGKFYQKTKSFIFIESNREQAIEICNVSGKQVFCTDTQELFSPESVLSMAGIVKNDLTITLKRVVKKLIYMYKKRGQKSPPPDAAKHSSE